MSDDDGDHVQLYRDTVCTFVKSQLCTSLFARKAAATSERSTKHTTTKTNKQKREKTTLKSGGQRCNNIS